MQLVDTRFVAYHVGLGANELYLGIEFESITGKPGQDVVVNADKHTLPQIEVGGAIVSPAAID